MALKFRRGTTAQKSGSLAFGEPYVNTTLGTLQIGGPDGDITLGSTGTGSTGNFGAISGSGLDITGNANVAGNLTLGGQLTIGDNTSDTVNVVASLSSSLIPQTTNVFDLGSADKIWRDLYISTGSIKFVDGTTVVKSLSLNTLTNLETATGSSNTSIASLNDYTSSLKTSLSVSGSNLTVLGNLTVQGDITTINTANLLVEDHIVEIAIGANTSLEADGAGLRIPAADAIIRWSHSGSAWSSNKSFDVMGNITLTGTVDGVDVASLETRNSTLATYTGSNDTKWSTLGSLSGSFARTNSTNTFNGSQTVSGSLTVTQDLIVLGSSSIQTISSSNIEIGAAYVTLNTATPSSRYAGLRIIDSGSAGGSGSFFYDAVQDEFIFVHRGNGTNVTSSHFVMGPETIDNLGNEIYLTNNRLVKGTGKEHIVDSNITDDGTTISLGSNVVITGSITVSGNVDGVDVSVLNSNINSFSSSALTRLSTLEVETSNLEATTASLNISVTNLNTTTASLLIETTNLELFTASLSTTSNVRFGSLGIGMAASGTSGRIDAANDIVAFSTSDIRLKENIVPIPNAIEKIRKISGNTYDWKAELKDVHGYEGNDVGVIAQEVESVLPQLVQDRDNGYKAVKYDKIVALLIEGIKEQQQHIDNLTIQVEELKKQKGL
jgi:hypothetical protein